MLLLTASDAMAVPVTGGDASAETAVPVTGGDASAETRSAEVPLLSPPLEEATEVGVSGGDALEETGIEPSDARWEEEEEEKNARADGPGMKMRKREDRKMKSVTAMTTTIGRLRTERKEEMAIPPLFRRW